MTGAASDDHGDRPRWFSVSSGRRAPRPSIDELALLRRQLEDRRAAITGTRAGGVDAALDYPDDGRGYPLTSAARPHRAIVEEMGEGAATVSEHGLLLFVNQRLADLVGRDRRDLVGTGVAGLTTVAHLPALDELLAGPAGETRRDEIDLIHLDGHAVPALASATGLDIDGVPVRCLIASDLTSRRRAEQQRADANTEHLQLMAHHHRLHELDLADDIVQQLFAIGLALRTTQRQLAEQEPAAAARIDDHMDGLQRVIHQLRSTILEAGPPTTDNTPPRQC